MREDLGYLEQRMTDQEGKFIFKFNKATGIFTKQHFGRVTVEDIVSSWEYAFENCLIPEGVTGFVVDFQKASLDMKIPDHLRVSGFYAKHLDILGGFKYAVLVSTPRDMVMPVLISTQDKGYITRPFSTLEAALDWLNI